MKYSIKIITEEKIFCFLRRCLTAIISRKCLTPLLKCLILQKKFDAEDAIGERIGKMGGINYVY